MKLVRIADDEYLGIIKSHIDCLASFEDIPNFNLLAPIGEFILKAMIMDCYIFGDRHPNEFKIMQDAENIIRSRRKETFRFQQQLPPFCDFPFSDLIQLWLKGSGPYLWSLIHNINFNASFRHFDFNQFRALRNDAAHSNRIINKISTHKHYYMLLEMFDLVIPSHIGLSYPSILNEYNCYFKNRVLNKEDKQIQLDEIIIKLDQLKQKHDQQPETQHEAYKSDKMEEILNKIDFINFIDSLKQTMTDHVEGLKSKQTTNCSIEPHKLINENNYLTFIDKMDFGKELSICEIDKYYPNINYDLIPFSSSNVENADQLILLDYKKDLDDEMNCESDRKPYSSQVNTTTDDGFISGTFGWIKKLTKAGSFVADKFLADVIKRAEDGNAHFQNIHGVFHFHGSLVSKDIDEAFKWFVASASQGYAPAQLNLGLMYFSGFKVKVNHARAAELFLKAANQGLLEAIEVLAVMHYFGEGVEKNQSLAEKWFAKAAEGGSAKAQENLGIIYYKNGDYFKSVEYLAMAAKNHVESAQNLLGVIYCNCDEVKDYGKAENMFNKAIKNGSINSRINLGILYFREGQFNKSLKDIEKILKKISTDNSDAQFCLGVMYYKSGYFEEALKWLEMAAKKEIKAQYNLGTMNYNGEGFSKSIDDALKIYNRVADNYPLVNAYLSLGFIHYNGIKTQRLYREALEYFKLAAEQGSPLADKILAKMYYNGTGTEIDYDLFYQRCRSAYIRGEHDVLEFAQLP